MIRDGRHLMNHEYRREVFLSAIFDGFVGATQMLRFAEANHERIEAQYRKGALLREHLIGFDWWTDLPTRAAKREPDLT